MPDSGDNAHVYRSVFQGEFEVNSGVYILSFSPPLGGGGILSSCWGVGEENQVGKIGQKRKGREIMK